MLLRLALILVLCACAGRAPAPGPAAGALEGSYSGLIPCADCPGIRYALTLLPDSVAVRRMTYLEAEDGRDLTLAELRRWRLDEGGRLVLYGAAGEREERLLVREGGVLSMLDGEGRPIRSGLNYDLARVAGAPRGAEEPLELRGHYRYMADAGLFTECATGRRFPVAQEEGNVGLQRAYGAAAEQPGAPVLVTLVARVALRPAMEGEGREELSIVPVRVERVEGNGECGRPAPG